MNWKKGRLLLVLVIGAVVVSQTRWFNNELIRTYEFIAPDCERKILEDWKNKDVDFLLKKITAPNPLHRHAAKWVLAARDPIVPAMTDTYKRMTTSWYEEDRLSGYSALAARGIYFDTTPLLKYLKRDTFDSNYSWVVSILSVARETKARDVLLALPESDPFNTSALLTNAIYWHDVPAYRTKIENIAKNHPDKWHRAEAQKVLKEVWGVL
jgi:hypothetical protein